MQNVAGTIKGMTIEIGGNTAPLEQALKDTNKEIKTTQKELNEVNKLLKLDPTNTELLKQKQQLLGQQIGQTTTKLDALKQAQKQFDDEIKKGGTVNQEEYRKIQREIISAESSLKGLKTQAKECNPQLASLREGLKKAGEVAQTGLKVGCDLVVTGLQAMGVAAVSAITSLAALGLKAGAAADDLNTLASTTGLSTKELQEFQYASDLIDVSVDTLAGALKKTTSSMISAQSGTGKAAEAYKRLGVSVTDAQGNLRDNNDVFQESIRALGNIANETERDAIAMQLFGKSATELNPLIEGGIDTLADMSKKANELGLVLSQDAIDGANKFNDQLDILKANGKGIFNKIGNQVARDLVPAMEKANEVTESVIKRLSTRLDTDGIRGAINEIAVMFNEIDWAEVGTMISDGLNTVLEVANEFISTIDWQQLGANIIEFLKNIDWASLIGGLMELVGGIIGGSIGVLKGAVENLADDVGKWWQEKLEENGGDGGKAFLKGAEEVITTTGGTLYDTLAQPLAQGIADALNIDVEIPNFHKLTQNIGIWWEELKLNVHNNIVTPIENFFLAIRDKFVTFFETIKGAWESFWTTISTIVTTVKDFFSGIFENIGTFVENVITKIADFFTGIGTKIKDFFTVTLPEKWQELKDWFAKLPDQLADIGKNLVEGLWNGIKGMKDWLWKKLQEWCDSILDGVKGWFGIESPSKVMADEVGKYLAQGVGVGFDKTLPSVVSAMQDKLTSVTSALQTELAFGDIPQIQGNQVISENQYITRNYTNTVETIRQPQTVELVLDGTRLARAMIQPLDNEYNRLGVKI